MNIGCHAVLFTNQIAEDTVGVLSNLKNVGGKGAEIGSRFFGVENSDKLCEALTKTNMMLSGIHVGINLASLLDEPQKAKETLENVAEFLQHVPCKNIIMTGDVGEENRDKQNVGDDRLTTEIGTKQMAEELNKIAKYIAENYNVRLNYHNHNWEFRNDAIIFNALAKFAPNLFFALDIGWVAVSGYDPIVIMSQTCKDRVKYVHLRDYKKSIAKNCKSFKEFQESYVEIGEGDINYKLLLNTVENTVGEDGWAVIEYEKGTVDADRYKKAITFINCI